LDGARALRELGRFDEAEALLSGAKAMAEAMPALLVAQGELMAARGKDEEATAVFLQAIRRDPHYTEPFLSLSRLLQRQGDLASAHALLEAGLDQNPKDLLLWQALVGLAASTGDIRAAARFAWEALAVFPQGGEGVWHGFVAAALVRQGCIKEASEVLAKGLKAFPGDPELEAINKNIRALSK
jgi:predicted Zn-dependent protease